MLFFIASFTEYHQIPMFQPDEEQTVFVTPHGLYCYRVIPFGLKNVGATYQRLMTKIFKPLIDQTMEVCIDDIVMKSRIQSEHAQHLEETFHLMRTYNMRLNPTKYAFGVSTGKFLGFMVTQKGIQVDSNKIKIVIETLVPSSKKELQHLTSHLAALGCFIACFTDKLRSCFLTLKGVSATDWRNECGWALDEVKHYLTKPPILSSP